MELDSPTAGLTGAPFSADSTDNNSLVEDREATACTSAFLGTSTALSSWESQHSPFGHAVPAPAGTEAERLPSDDKVPRYKRPSLQAWEDALIQGIETFPRVGEVVEESMVGKRLVVCEDRWYAVFMKDRWIDYNEKALTLEKRGHDTVWSADDPAVWRELRPCIELASRTLGQAVRGPWLSSLLDSSAHETSHGVRYEMDWEGVSVRGPLVSSIRRFVQVTPTRRLAPETVDDLLRTTDHLVSWSFFSPSDEKAALESSRGKSICAVDFQDTGESERSRATISLDVSMLGLLLGTRMNATEKAAVQHTVGVNMVLAYVDALAQILGQLFLDEERKQNPGSQHPKQQQLFFGDEPVADHRGSFCNSLFGAKLEFPSYQCPSENKRNPGVKSTPTARQFPLADDALRQLFADGEVTGPRGMRLAPNKLQRHSSFAVPSAWQVSMMNEDFWGVQVAKFGAMALRAPRNVETENIFHPAWSMRSAIPINTLCLHAAPLRDIIFEDAKGRGVKVQSSARPLTGLSMPRGTFKRFAKRLETKPVLENKRRKWYSDMFADWHMLPRANVDFVEDLRLLAEEYFIRRSEHDEFRADEIAQRWIAMPGFLRADTPLTFALNAHMCRAVGLAVMASLPARMSKKCSRMSETPGFVLPVRHTGGNDKEVLEARVALLGEAARALEVYEGKVGATAAVSKPLRVQIRYGLHVLRNQAIPETLASRAEGDSVEDGAVPTRGPGRWLDFFFQVADCSSPEEAASQLRSMLLRKNQLEETLVREPCLTTRRPNVANKKYWSVGEVADHISMVDLWVLLRDGGGFLVYDVTAPAFRMRFKETDMEARLEYTEHGRVLKRSLEETFGNYAKFAKPKGRLIRWYTESDMALMTLSERSRVVLGDEVYDTKDLNYGKFGTIRDKVRNAITEASPGDLRRALRIHGLEEHISSIKKTLEPFRCGRLKRKKFTFRGGPLYTRDELSWFVSADAGMYTAVNGTVYDLTDFVDWHPGGRRVLLVHAVGKDATDMVRRLQCCVRSLEGSLGGLAVGRIVEAHEGDVHAPDEFRINNYIYMLGPEGKSGHDDLGNRLSELISSLSGATAEQLVRQGDETAMDIARRTELIVGKTSLTARLPRVSLLELAKCDGAEDESGYNEAWIAVSGSSYADGHVYNVTSILRGASPELKKVLMAECGKRTDKVAVAQWLRRHHAGRIVAELRREAPAWDPTEKLWRHDKVVEREFGRSDERSRSDSSGSSRLGPVSGLFAPFGVFSNSELAVSAQEVTYAADLEGFPPSGWKEGEPGFLSAVNEEVERRLRETYQEEMHRQRALRAQARESLRNSRPETPLVRVRKLARGETPPPGRNPVSTIGYKRGLKRKGSGEGGVSAKRERTVSNLPTIIDKGIPVASAGPAQEGHDQRMISLKPGCPESVTTQDTEMWDVDKTQSCSLFSEITEGTDEELLPQMPPSVEPRRWRLQYQAVSEDPATPESSTGDTDMWDAEETTAFAFSETTESDDETPQTPFHTATVRPIPTLTDETSSYPTPQTSPAPQSPPLRHETVSRREQEDRSEGAGRPGFFLPRHRYTPPPEGLQPSEFSVRRREEEKRRRGERGPLAAGSPIMGRFGLG